MIAERMPMGRHGNMQSARLLVDRGMKIICASPRFASLGGRQLEDVISDVRVDLCLLDSSRCRLLEAVANVFAKGATVRLSAEPAASSSVRVRNVGVQIARMPCSSEINLHDLAGFTGLDEEAVLVTFNYPAAEREEYVLPSCAERIEGVIKNIERLAVRKGFATVASSKDAIRLRLAAEEALQNAIDHGCQGDGNQTIRACVTASAKRVTISIRDPGKGQSRVGRIKRFFTPRRALAERGRGLTLMRHSADEVRFNGAGNEVTMVFHPRVKGATFRSRPAVPDYLLSSRMRMVPVAAMIALFVMLPTLWKPTRTDALAAALRTAHNYRTIHVVGLTGQYGLKPGRRGPTHPYEKLEMQPFELWWTRDNQAWLKMGDQLFVRIGSTVWMRNPRQAGNGYSMMLLNGNAGVNTEWLSGPEAYLRSLGTPGGVAPKVQTSLSGNRDVITVEQGSRRDSIEVDRRTHALVGAETFLNGTAIRRLHRFEYDRDVPAAIAREIDSFVAVSNGN